MQSGKWLSALKQTRQTTFGRLASLLGASELTPAFWEQLEAALIQADLGIETTIDLLDQLRSKASKGGITSGYDLQSELTRLLLDQLQWPSPENDRFQPCVTMVVGVNGSGKTTVAARLAKRWQGFGQKILLAAADTYRAAASQQLAAWSKKLSLEIISGKPGSDPGAVVYDACQAALARSMDHLLIDTSGRMHTHHNLMAELQKMCRVAKKVIPEAPHQIYLVLDSTTGQNGLAQARAFAQAIPITGVVLAKLDNSARGGVIFAIRRELNLPVLYVGLGEGIEDLESFDPEAFIHGLFVATSFESSTPSPNNSLHHY